MSKFASDELITFGFQVDRDFDERALNAALTPTYKGNKSDWARDILARALGFSSYAEYAQFVRENRLTDDAYDATPTLEPVAA